MRKVRSIVLLIVLSCLFLAFVLPCLGMTIALVVLLGPFWCIAKNSHNREVERLEEAGYDVSICTSEEFSAHANVTGGVLIACMIWPIFILVPLMGALENSWFDLRSGPPRLSLA